MEGSVNTKQMSDRLNELKAGMKIRFTDGHRAGKIFNVRFVQNTPGKKFNATTVVMLEEGKPETYTVNGIGLNAGKVLEMSNAQIITLYAQKPYMNWEIVTGRDS